MIAALAYVHNGLSCQPQAARQRVFIRPMDLLAFHYLQPTPNPCFCLNRRGLATLSFHLAGQNLTTQEARMTQRLIDEHLSAYLLPRVVFHTQTDIAGLLEVRAACRTTPNVLVGCRRCCVLPAAHSASIYLGHLCISFMIDAILQNVLLHRPRQISSTMHLKEDFLTPLSVVATHSSAILMVVQWPTHAEP